MNDRLRIVLTHVYAWPEVRRGGERYLHELASALADAGHQVSILSTATAPGHGRILGIKTRYLRRHSRPLARRFGELSPEVAFDNLESNPLGDTEGFRQRTEAIFVASIAATDEIERRRVGESGEGLKGDVDAFALVEPTDHQEPPSPRPFGCRLVRRGKVAPVDPAVHDGRDLWGPARSLLTPPLDGLAHEAEGGVTSEVGDLRRDTGSAADEPCQARSANERTRPGVDLGGIPEPAVAHH